MYHLRVATVIHVLFATLGCGAQSHAATIRIGDVLMVKNKLEARLSDERWNSKIKGEDVYESEYVRTAEFSNAEFALVDKTGIVMGPQSTFRFDRIVYNPNNAIRGITVSVAFGAIRYTNGKSAANQIETLHARITPRGTAFDVFVEAEKTTAVLREGSIQVCSIGGPQNCRTASIAGDVIIITNSNIDGPIQGGPTPSDFANRCLSASSPSCVITANVDPPTQPRRRSASRTHNLASYSPTQPKAMDEDRPPRRGSAARGYRTPRASPTQSESLYEDRPPPVEYRSYPYRYRYRYRYYSHPDRPSYGTYRHYQGRPAYGTYRRPYYGRPSYNRYDRSYSSRRGCRGNYGSAGCR